MGFTALFEALVIDWLRAVNTKAVAQRLRLPWDQVDGVMQRAGRRGLARRELAVLGRLRDRFHNAIYFRLSGFDLYPEALTHSNS